MKLIMNLLVFVLFSTVAIAQSAQTDLAIGTANVVQKITSITGIDAVQQTAIENLVAEHFGDLENATPQQRRRAYRQRIASFMSDVEAELTAAQLSELQPLKTKIERNYRLN